MVIVAPTIPHRAHLAIDVLSSIFLDVTRAAPPIAKRRSEIGPVILGNKRLLR
jgi:hypothetical protein